MKLLSVSGRLLCQIIHQLSSCHRSTATMQPVKHLRWKNPKTCLVLQSSLVVRVIFRKSWWAEATEDSIWWPKQWFGSAHMGVSTLTHYWPPDLLHLPLSDCLALAEQCRIFSAGDALFYSQMTFLCNCSLHNMWLTNEEKKKKRECQCDMLQ